MTEQIGEKILEKIKEGHIKPKPRWEFLLKNYVTWAIFAIAILIGSQATGVMIFMMNHTEWEDYIQQESFPQQILMNLPFFWLVVLIIFIAVAFYNIKHTKQGYKHSPLIIVLLSIIISLAIGTIVYATGGGERLEDIFYRRVGFYQQIMRQSGRMFINPEQGRIAGVIIEITPDSVIVEDFQGNIWKIVTSTENLILGQRVHILGNMLPDQQFETQIIKPHFRPFRPPKNPCLDPQICPGPPPMPGL
ncbi:MAG: hypothetical protein WC675_05195 [Patescibacteria group bacterium]|jgi:hypothetical protein